MQKYTLKACEVYPIEDNYFDFAIELLSSCESGKEDEYDINASMDKVRYLYQFKNVFDTDANRKNRSKYILLSTL